jgi:hypothetical protein
VFFSHLVTHDVHVSLSFVAFCYYVSSCLYRLFVYPRCLRRCLFTTGYTLLFSTFKKYGRTFFTLLSVFNPLHSHNKKRYTNTRYQKNRIKTLVCYFLHSLPHPAPRTPRNNLRERVCYVKNYYYCMLLVLYVLNVERCLNLRSAYTYIHYYYNANQLLGIRIIYITIHTRWPHVV